MNVDLEHLVVLQAQDLELARLRAELGDAPRQNKAAADQLLVAQTSLGRCRERLLAEEKLRRAHESEIGTHRTKIARLERSLQTATSAQQVAAFQHEIDFAKAAIARLDDEAFASLERSEALEAERTAAEAALGRSETALATTHERTAALTLSHEAAIAGIGRERSQLRAQITPAVLANYDRLAKTRGTALAEALGTAAAAGKCAACQMSVRPQRWQDLTGRDHDDEIFACESCGRLLFWDPRRDTPRPWAAGDRLQSAQTRTGRPAAKSTSPSVEGAQ